MTMVCVFSLNWPWAVFPKTVTGTLNITRWLRRRSEFGPGGEDQLLIGSTLGEHPVAVQAVREEERFHGHGYRAARPIRICSISTQAICPMVM